MHSQQSWQRILCFWACSQKCSVALTAIPEIQPLLNCLSSWVTAETLKNSWIKPSKTLPKYHETLNWFVNCFRELIQCGGGKRLKSRVPWQNNCRRTNKGKQRSALFVISSCSLWCCTQTTGVQLIKPDEEPKENHKIFSGINFVFITAYFSVCFNTKCR